ncbi:lysine-2,3-aminomutase-like protein [Falsirhodobacter xinxiangensis]|uniref:lysine-2,3-aminomutase-like protein n=1 Tax=Falsirhodobacter xinxiangensis TaxID=2530049 RepID=UPI0010A9F75D|nr:lysine-2,3-aminomutase-like protein [Rhodobacter xinxiangensis]
MAPRKPAITKVADLIREGLADPSQAEVLDRVAENFRIRITPGMQGHSEGLARQFVPSPQELTIRPEELADPIGDDVHSPVPGLTHRYPDRVILHATQTCEVYCRFCFRREAVGEDGALGDAELDAAIDYIARTPEIWEVILTGGDPMVLSPRRLSALLARLSAIEHVGVVRFHTRVPVVAPEKVNTALIAALRVRPAVYVVIHTNHPDELTPEACAALARLADAGIPLLSQTVLLQGVNADAEVLAQLFRLLVMNRVKPYYLHHCDLARGTGHFRTTLAAGQAIMSALRGRVSGVCLPTYVLDLPGGYGKVPVGPVYVSGEGPFRITDYLGRAHIYADP